MGRPRTPRAIKLKTGVHPYRIHDELEGKGEIGQAPKTFSAEERVIWYEVLEQVPLRLSAGERHTLERYCKAMVRIRRLEAEIDRTGYVGFDPRRQVEVKNPRLSLLNSALKELERTNRQLGLGLLNRSSLSLKPERRPGPYAPEDFSEDIFILCFMAENDAVGEPFTFEDPRHSMHGLFHGDPSWQPTSDVEPLPVRREKVTPASKPVRKRSLTINGGLN